MNATERADAIERSREKHIVRMWDDYHTGKQILGQFSFPSGHTAIELNDLIYSEAVLCADEEIKLAEAKPRF